MNTTVKNLFEAKHNEIATVLRSKYPNIVIERPFTTDSTRYDHTGNKALHSYYYSKVDCRIENKESSHPQLGKPFVRFTITVTLEKGELTVDTYMHIDSVPVNYCTFESKVNNRNVTLGRKQYRQVSKYLYGAFKNKVAHKVTLTQLESDSLEQSLRLLKEQQNLNSYIYNKLTRSVKDTPKGLTCPLTQIRREANSYYFNNEKIGTKDNIASYIRKHIKSFINDFDSQYPEITKSESISA